MLGWREVQYQSSRISIMSLLLEGVRSMGSKPYSSKLTGKHSATWAARSLRLSRRVGLMRSIIHGHGGFLCGSTKICCLSSSWNVFGSRSMGAASRPRRMACTSAITHTPQSYPLCCWVVPYSGSHQKLHNSRSMHYHNNHFLPRMPVKSIPALGVCEHPNSIHILLKKLGIDCSRQSIKEARDWLFKAKHKTNAWALYLKHPLHSMLAHIMPLREGDAV